MIQVKHCTPGEIIFRENNTDDSAIYFIEKGAAEIIIELIPTTSDKTIKPIKKLHKGESFGANSFFTGLDR